MRMSRSVILGVPETPCKRYWAKRAETVHVEDPPEESVQRLIPSADVSSAEVGRLDYDSHKDTTPGAIQLARRLLHDVEYEGDNFEAQRSSPLSPLEVCLILLSMR